MLVQQVLHAMNTESLPSGAGKQHGTVPSRWLVQPGCQHGTGGLGEGDTAFFTPLANHAHVRAGASDQVLAFASGHLG
jgi:hypothetical protein